MNLNQKKEIRGLNGLSRGPIRKAQLLSSLRKFILLALATWLLCVRAMAQVSGGNPAVTARMLAPLTLKNVGSVFSMTFTIGNNGAVGPITGTSEDDRMGFTIDLKQCGLSQPTEKALTGSALNWFDVNYNSDLNRIEGRQKPGVSLGVITLGKLVISAIVTQASSTTADNSIGAACTILPNASSGPNQSLDDDYGYVYTHTQVTVIPDAPVGFVAQAQPDQTVLLTWSASPDRTNKDYTIERSKDMKRFEAVGKLAEGSIGRDKLSQYTFVDSKPYRGTSYYRLQQVDPNGTAHAYLTGSVEVNGQYGVDARLVAGQPFTLTLDEPTSAVVHLYTDTGKEIPVNRSNEAESSVQLSPASKLEPGSYVLIVEERATTRQHRLLVR